MVFSPIKTFGEWAGGIKNMFWMPCAYQPLLWVETFVPAAIKVFISYEQPDPKHVIHHETGKSVLCHLETVANDMEVVEPSFADQALQFVFEFDKVLDQAVFWMFIADIFGEGLMNWTTMYFKMAGCNRRPNPNSSSGQGMAFGEPGTTEWGPGCHCFAQPGDPSPLVPFGFQPKANGNCSLLQTGSLYGGVLAIPTATRWINYGTGEVQKDTTASLKNWDPADTPTSFFQQGGSSNASDAWGHELMSPIGDRFNRITGGGSPSQFCYMQRYTGG